MKRLTIIILFLTTVIYANINAIVSILPEQTFLKAIGGNKVNISLMVQMGSSPHTYEPKPSQMVDINKADIYFTIGVEFEKVWLPKFINQNKDMIIADISQNILKTEDPHIWVSPSNVKQIVTNIYNSLVLIDKTNQSYYKDNLDKYLQKINNLDLEIKDILKNTPKDSYFMVFHPAWGHFAKEYNLIQLAIEIDGKQPKPKDIIKIIKQAKQHNVNAIFTAPEFSSKVALQIAKEIDIKVIKISSLNPNWSENLLKLAKGVMVDSK